MPRKRKKSSIPKTCGIETELGVSHEGMRENANYQFVEDYRTIALRDSRREVEWDATSRLNSFDEEDQEEHAFFVDARWRKVSNILMENGARLYVDNGPHTEWSSPTCPDARSLLTWNRAGYRELDRIRLLLARQMGRQYRITRNNIARDAKYYTGDFSECDVPRDTFASHLSITIDRRVPVDILIQNSIQLFICLLPVVCAGKVGSDNKNNPAFYQISQRADWIVEPFSGSTTASRGIVNTRDNPYADEKKYRRMHIICFDSNMLEAPEYIKTGVISLFYKALEDGAIKDLAEFRHPVRVFHEVSRDLTVSKAYECINRKRPVRVTDWLLRLHGLLAKYRERYHPEDSISLDVLRRFYDIVTKLAARDFDGLCGISDWVTKKYVIEESVIRKGKSWKDNLAYMIDYRFHDNDHHNGLFFRNIAKMKAVLENRILTEDDEPMIEYACREAPPTRNRWFPKIVMGKFGPHVRAWDWGSLTLAPDPARTADVVRLYFGDPARWNEEEANELLSLPITEFIEKIQERGIATRTREFEVSPGNKDYESLYSHYGMPPPDSTLITRLRRGTQEVLDHEQTDPYPYAGPEDDEEIDLTTGWLLRRMMGETHGKRHEQENKTTPPSKNDATPHNTPVHPDPSDVILDRKAPKPRLVWNPRRRPQDYNL